MLDQRLESLWGRFRDPETGKTSRVPKGAITSQAIAMMTMTVLYWTLRSVRPTKSANWNLIRLTKKWHGKQSRRARRTIETKILNDYAPSSDHPPLPHGKPTPSPHKHNRTRPASTTSYRYFHQVVTPGI